MLALNVSCAICKAKFEKTDSIYSTTCGHVFHFTCMNKWQSRSTSCPVCRTYNPQNFRIYLNFGDGDEHNLEVKLKANEDQMKQMQETIDKKDKKIDRIKRLYIISEQWRAELQDKIQKLPLEYEAENDKLSKTLQLKLEEIESLKVCTETKKIPEDDRKLGQYEFENLKEKLLTSEFENIDLNQKIKMLELKLQLITKELRERIKESADLTIANADKGQLSSTKIVDKSKAGHKKRNKMNNLNKTKTISKDDLTTFTTESKSDKMNNLNKTTTIPNDDLITTKLEPKDNYKICIQDFPKKELIATISLKTNVVLLASKMFLFLNESDIAQVDITKEMHGYKSHYINLIVTFESIEKKKFFISNRNLLKLNPSTKSIRIKEYIDSDVYAVFKYANENLRTKSIFNFIYCKDNQVIAKRNRHDTTEVRIKNKSDVDELLAARNE